MIIRAAAILVLSLLLTTVFAHDVSETKSKPQQEELPHTQDGRDADDDAEESWDSIDFLNEELQLFGLLAKEHVVSAVLHYIETTHNRTEDGGVSECHRTSFVRHFKYKVSPKSYEQFERQAHVAVRTANLLTGYFLRANNISDPLHNEALYWSLVKINVDTDPEIFSSGIAFGRETSALFCPYAFRHEESGDTTLVDLATSYNQSYDDPESVGNEWFWQQAEKNFTQLLVDSLGSIHVDAFFEKGGNLAVNLKDGVWTPPYFDCGASDSWLVSYSAPFFGRRGNTIVFRGVSMISINLKNVDINQCANDDTLFADTHKCDRETTKCVPLSGFGFRRGAYRCYCRDGFYFPGSESEEITSTNYFNGTVIETAFLEKLLGGDSGQSGIYPYDFRCLPCKPGCEPCRDGSSCFVEYNMIVRSLALGLQSFCTTITVVLCIVVFRLRRSKVVASSRWLMLEMILVGAFLLYQTVIIRYFEPSTVTCLMEPWFRELGFAICYGAITLKIYRIFAEFQTRKAHRVCVRDKDLLKYLLGIILVVVGYMAAWTAVMMENIYAGDNILEQGTTPQGLKYFLCRELWWDYVTESGEIVFLLSGLYLAYCIRNAKVEGYQEKQTLCAALCIETVSSLAVYCARHVLWLSLEPDYLFLMYFLRCQLTVSVVLTFVFGPKLWYHHRPPDSSEFHHPSRHFSSCEVHDHVPEAMKLHEAIMSNGELDISDINLADMDPEDIRAELRRVYTQLQILRNKTMRKDNPHISKRRGGRKVTHRRFSLQPFHHKHKHHEHEPEMTEVSKTPEESVASIEGTNVHDEPSTKTEPPQPPPPSTLTTADL